MEAERELPIRKQWEGDQEGEKRGPPGPHTRFLERYRIHVTGAPKECRCPTWPQMDFTGSLFLAVFTST